MQENDNFANTNEEGGFGLRDAVSYFLRYWKLFALSVCVCLAIAYLHVRSSVPQYQVTAKILLQDKEKGSFSSQADMLSDFGLASQTSNIDNEIEVINSMSVVRRAVLVSELYVSYVVPGFCDVHLYKDATPLRLSFDQDSLGNLLAPVNVYFAFSGNATPTVRYDYINEGMGIEYRSEAVALDKFPFVLSTVAGDVVIERNEKVAMPEKGELNACIMPLNSAMSRYKSSLSVAPVSKTSSVAILAVRNPLVQNGVDFLNAVMESYNFVTNEDKRQVARKTETFILDRIDSLSVELEAMEIRLADYKKKNQLIDAKVDAPLISQNKTQYTKQLEEIDLMIASSRYLNEFVNNPANDMKVIPTTFGLTVDQALAALIANYNREVVAHDQLARTVTKDNPNLKISSSNIKTMQDDLRAALKALDKSLTVQRKAIAALVDNYTNRFLMSPDIERELLTITRECDVKSGLYVMLLQKYEENALNLAVTADNLRCIDTPTGAGMVSPDANKIYMLAFVISLLIPASLLYLLHMLNVKISSVDEVQKELNIPHVGTIPDKKNKNKSKSPIVVEKDNNDVMAEAFRALRTNLQFVMKKTTGKIVMFTSTTSGEGKTFIASNLAVSTALLGKKVLLVGLDIRRPRLAEAFGFDVKADGLTSYLASDVKNVEMLDRCIVPSNVVPGLDVLAAGIVPPNPAELLSRQNLDRAFEYLSQKYDSIILDTAPVGLVSDSLIVSRVADAVVYVLRLDYTLKEDIPYIKSLVADEKLENVSIVVNGDKVMKKTYGYTGYGASKHRSGYGYAPKKRRKW